MRPSTQDQVAGKIHEVKGAIKQKVGHVTNNPDMGRRGYRRKASREGAKENRPGGKSLRKAVKPVVVPHREQA